MLSVAISLMSILFMGGSYAQTFRGGELKTYETYLYGKFETRVKA
jgi:beta-glucanase (GH16 family)